MYGRDSTVSTSSMDCLKFRRYYSEKLLVPVCVCVCELCFRCILYNTFRLLKSLFDNYRNLFILLYNVGTSFLYVYMCVSLKSYIH